MFRESVEVLLSMTSNLGAIPRPNMFLNLPPVLSKELQTLNKFLMFFMSPSTLELNTIYKWAGAAHSSHLRTFSKEFLVLWKSRVAVFSLVRKFRLDFLQRGVCLIMKIWFLHYLWKSRFVFVLLLYVSLSILFARNIWISTGHLKIFFVFLISI